MRLAIALFSLVLFLIAFAGIGFGVAVVSQAMHQSNAGLLGALSVSVLPFMIGVIALGSATIVITVESARDEQCALLREVISIGRRSAPGGNAPSTDPAVLSKRARETPGQ
jgi:hypothetical protein